MSGALADLILSPVITCLVEKLGSAVLQEFARLEGIHSLINKWTGKLEQIKSVINDAEDKHISDDSVKLWLQSLRELADDLDDIVDEIVTEASRRRDLGACCMLSPRSLCFNYKMISKFKDMTIRLEDIEKQKNGLHLRELGDGGISKRNDERLPTTSLEDKFDVYGREEKKKEIMELLLAKEAGKTDVCVIPIVGMGGIGKTTLAQLVYNDPLVIQNFDLKAWVCVSDKLDVLAATKAIFNAVTEESGESKDLNTLHESLKKKLSNKRFLIILDDVWNEEYEKWNLLRRPFQSGSPGSKVIVTTRNDGVASLVCSPSVPPCRVEKLTNDDCLSILAGHALETKNFDMHPNLKEIGEALARKCGGLPLAAKALGGVLRPKVHPDEWEDILNSNIWELPLEKNILPVLRLSYHHLPSHLKRLFAYCSIFPKDYEFDKWELVLLWMGEGLLRQSDGRKTIEDVGIESFKELMSRSFFQPLSRSDSRFVMHDLIHDLSEFVAGGTCHRLDKKGDIFNFEKSSPNTRHASFIRQEYDAFKKFKNLDNVRGLRTFISLPMCRGYDPWLPDCYLSNRVVLQLLPGLRSLRVLALNGYNISELPSSIGSLIHLRYLNLDFTEITSLPQSLGKLYNLETLSIRACPCKLPETLKNLVNLRHLYNSQTSVLKEMPMGIGKLTNLRTLSMVIIGKDCGFRLTELKDLPHVGGSLSIMELQNVVDIQEAQAAGLKHKTNLRRLKLMWRYSSDVSYDASLNEDVMDKLEPPRELEKLKICGFGGSKFPKWIGDDPSFLKLESIRLDDCANCTAIPTLGTLPMLKHLEIRNMPKVKCLGIEFFMGCHPIEHPFPSLMTLEFSKLLEWEEWSWSHSDEEVGVQFPCLRELRLSSCPKLSKVSPQKLPLLCTLSLENCSNLVMDSLKDLSSLATLKLSHIVGLSNLPKEFMELAEKTIEVLHIEGCDDLVALWQNGVIAQNLIHLRELHIWLCSQLIYLGEDNPLPPNLEVMDLSICESLTCLSNELSSLTSLRELEINNCPRLVSLPDKGIPSTLTTLHILDCNALTYLPRGMSGVKSLVLLGCSSLEAWPVDYMTTSHKRICIENSSHLEQVQEERFSSDNTLCVEDLAIGRCNNFTSFFKLIPLFSRLVSLFLYHLDILESFPDQSLHNPNLRFLLIESCSNLKSLPLHLHKISSLEYLEVHNCPRLEAFLGGDLPLSLTSLEITDCGKLKPLAEWQLNRLTGLTVFKICGGFPDLVSFDKDGHLFPPTLTDLHIQGFPNLKSLSKGLDCIASLEHLCIGDCPKLRKLPSQGLLNSLQSLHIWNCSGLKGKSGSKITDFVLVSHCISNRTKEIDLLDPPDLNW